MKAKQSIKHQETLEITITLQELEDFVRKEMLHMLDKFEFDSAWTDSGSIPLCEDITLKFGKSYREDGVELG